MLYIHYCTSCKKVYMLSGHKQECPKCDNSITELKITYKDYSLYTSLERDTLLWKLTNPDYLRNYKRHYRFAIHTKRYKEKQKDKTGNIS